MNNHFTTPPTDNYMRESRNPEFVRMQNSLSRLADFMHRNNCYATTNEDRDLVIVSPRPEKNKS